MQQDIFDILSQQQKEKDVFDYFAEHLKDPSEPPLFERPKEPVIEAIGKTTEKVAEKGFSLFKKGTWAGLGIIAWPFERIEYTIATPLTKTLEERKKSLAEKGIDNGFGIFAPRILPKEDIIRENMAVLKSLGPVAKSLIPGRKAPEDVRTFNDFFGSYYEGLTGEPAPEWYKQISGGGASMLVTPYLFGKLLKGAGGAVKMTGIPQKIQAKRLPAWQQMKKLTRLEKGARIYDAKQLGKTLGNKEINKVAKELSKRTGRNITSRAVKLRLTQIIKGGVTVRPELAAKANPIIEEFGRMSMELKQLGILPEYTYVSKLPKKEVGELLKKRAALEKQITALSKVPYQETLTKLTTKLSPDINKQKNLTEKFLKVAIKAEEKGLKLSQMGDEFIDIAIEVNTGSPLSQKIASLMDFAPGDKRLTALGKRILSMEKMERTARIKEADQIIKTASKINPKVSKYVSQTIDDILKAASQIESTKVIGKSTLLKKIESMERSFPGKAKKTQELTDSIAKINDKLQQHYHLGGELYFPRMYLSKEEALAAKKGFPVYAQERIRSKYIKERMKIPEDIRKAMGEIKEPAYPVVKRMIQESNDIETGKLFDFAAKNPKWASKTWIEGFVKEALPDTKAYGALRGMYVNPVIHKDVTELMRVKSDIERLYDIGMGTWKLGKTVWNPAVHFRNMFSNSVLLDLSGMDHIQQAKYIGKAMKHISSNSDDYQQAMRYFSRTTEIRGELLDDMLRGFKVSNEKGIIKIVDGLNKGVIKASQKPSEVYQAEEFLGKFIKYLEQREQGKTVIEAVNEANKWLFDYRDLSSWERNIARRIMPFYTFPRKALPRILEAAANRPYVLAKYPMMAKSMTQYSLYNLNLTAKDYEDIKSVLPEYMDEGSYILMPYRDANDDLRFFDWTWNVPWGGLFEADQRGLLKTTITNPLTQIVYDIKDNKSSWTGRQIYDDAIPPDKQTPEYRREQNFKKMLYVWQALAPNLIYKGVYWDKLYGAATGKKERGKDMLLPETIAHTIFGLRTQAVDVEENRRWKMLRMADGFDDLRGNIMKIVMQRSNGDITEEEFEKKYNVYIEQLQKFHLEMIEEEENAPSIEELLDVINDMHDDPDAYEETEKQD
ncbi:MAG: hypothetical protein JXA96_17125 [Sedimentisphaerales bacterium]|nr:hypothetical protein [Sedimentisphaerales bacterium]